MHRRLLITAFVLDVAVMLVAPLCAGVLPATADAAETPVQSPVLLNGRCYEITQFNAAHVRVEGELNLATCRAVDNK